VYERLKEIIVGKFDLDADDITPESTLEGLELDSLDLVELSLIIEKELGVPVTDDELAEARQIDAIVRLVEGRIAKV